MSLLSTNIAEFRLRWCLLEFEQASDSQIKKKIGPGFRFKNFETGMESPSENASRGMDAKRADHHI